MKRNVPDALIALRQAVAAATMSDADRVAIVKELDAFDRDVAAWVKEWEKHAEGREENGRRKGMLDVKWLIDRDLDERAREAELRRKKS